MRQADQLLTDADGHKIVESALAAYDEVAAALRPTQAAARELLDQQAQARQPVAQQIATWVEVERRARLAAAARIGLPRSDPPARAQSRHAGP